MSKILDFYFSFTSPYSYIAHTQLAGLAERTQCSIAYHTIDLGKIFELTGNARPISVPAKRKYLAKDIGCWCRYYNIPFKLSSRFPINTRPATAGAAIAQKQGKLPEFVEIVLQAFFVEDRDIADVQVLAELATKIGLDADDVAAGVNDLAILKEIDAETEAAAKRGVFGAPTFFVGDDMYFGSDRLMFVEQALK